ncbi:uncharacterized protein IUM83_03010 [Phytophthora cinnamomi]|uniref:uncharacterized protein n=1 Tax=Phytophthora cinnamomi TaxID=4785 RepID=UPI00355A89C2|nr:hypothetical protein IUM83_03010 [Phytophthora cinnamomi]
MGRPTPLSWCTPGRRQNATGRASEQENEAAAAAASRPGVPRTPARLSRAQCPLARASNGNSDRCVLPISNKPLALLQGGGGVKERGGVSTT